MANDTDATCSSTAFAASGRASSSPTSSSPPTPGASVGNMDAIDKLKSSTTSGNDTRTKPQPSVETSPLNGSDQRRTQSTSSLSRQTPSPTANSATSSPRNSFADSLSRSSSFLASLNNNISLIAGAVVSSPTATSGPVHTVEVVYSDPGPLYVDLYSRPDGKGAFVKSFRRKADGGLGNAEASGQVRVNDMLYSINSLVVTEMVFASIIQAAKTTTFPCTLVFHSRLPPPSPAAAASPAKSAMTGAGSSTWSSKFGQMMGENGLSRSASFDRKSFGDSTPSPVRRPSSVAANPSTPPQANNGSASVDKMKNWGDSITLEKVKNSDGVKNLLRMMGGSRSRPEEDRDTVEAWFDHLELKLEDSNHHAAADGYLASPLVVSTAFGGGRVLGVRDEDLNEFALTWYRKTHAQELIQIKNVRSGRYFPSIDDVDAKISVRCQSMRFQNLMRVIEFSQPLRIDPAVKEMVDILLEAGAGSFSATLASNEHDSFQIKISEERVVLVKISEDEDEGGVVVSVDYHVHLQVLVDPNDQLRFTLKVQELGSLLGCRAGDSCDVKRKQQLASVSCFFLVAQNPQHRDILTLLIRRFRARAVMKEEEDIAHRDELNLFMDLASSSFPSAQESSQDTGTFSPTREETATQSNGRRSFVPHVERRRNSHPKISPPADLPAPPPVDTFTSLFDVDKDMDMLSIRIANSGQDKAAPPSRTASFTSSPGTVRSSMTNGSDAPDDFEQERLVAQAREIAMLQEKLASMSVLVKSTEHEKAELVASLEVKDKRIESQQLRLQQLERSTVLLSASTRDLPFLRARLEEETRLHQACQQQLAKALEERQEAEMEDRHSQTDNQVEIPENYRLMLEKAQADAAALSVEAEALRRELTTTQRKLQHTEQEHHFVVSERNALRSRSAELAKELKKVVGPHRSLADVQAQLLERTHLATQLSLARADAKRAADEMQEYRDALDSTLKQQQQSGLADKDKAATQRLVAHNTELQRLVHQLTDSLNETREQMAAMKKINGALMSKMQRDNPDSRGSILESPPMSPMSVTSSVQDPRFSDDEDEEDGDEEDDDRDDDDEEENGSAELARSRHESSAASEDFQDAR